MLELCTISISVYHKIDDVTNSTNRTTRMSILNGVFSPGYVVGTTLGGKLYKKYANYYLNFGVSCGLAVSGIMYTHLFVRENIIMGEETNAGERASQY